MAEDKSGLYITLIVGVVAVLALLMMYMNGGGSLAASDAPTGLGVFMQPADAQVRGYGSADVFADQRLSDDTAREGEGRDMAMTLTEDRNRHCAEVKYRHKSYERTTAKGYCSGPNCDVVGSDGVTIASGVTCVAGNYDGEAYNMRPANVGAQY